MVDLKDKLIYIYDIKLKKASLMNEAKFSEWLYKKRKYTPKSARDVNSRIRRASKFINLDFNNNSEEIISHLENNIEFKELTTSVKSHIRIAIRLYKAFINKP